MSAPLVPPHPGARHLEPRTGLHLSCAVRKPGHRSDGDPVCLKSFPPPRVAGGRCAAPEFVVGDNGVCQLGALSPSFKIKSWNAGRSRSSGSMTTAAPSRRRERGPTRAGTARRSRPQVRPGRCGCPSTSIRNLGVDVSSYLPAARHRPVQVTGDGVPATRFTDSALSADAIAARRPEATARARGRPGAHAGEREARAPRRRTTGYRRRTARAG